MKLRNQIVQATKVIYSSDLILRLSSNILTKEQLIFVLCNLVPFPNNFKSLLVTGQKKAEDAGEILIAKELKKNFNDEIGLDINGEINPEESHGFWLQDFLDSLKISTEQMEKKNLIHSLIYFDNIIKNIENYGTIFNIVGAILFLEYSIPCEFIVLLKSLKKLFPETFLIRPYDSTEDRLKKEKALKYLVDHIEHDLRRHFPDLLSTVEKYQYGSLEYQQIEFGIQLTAHTLNNLYNNLEKHLSDEFQQTNSIQGSSNYLSVKTTANKLCTNGSPA